MNFQYKKLLVAGLALFAATAFTCTATAKTSGQSVGPANTSGQTGGPSTQTTQTVTLQNPLKVNSVGAAISEGTAIFSYVAVLVAVLALIWVGLQFILARGNTAKISELKNWLWAIVVGIAIVIGARIIIQIVVNTLGATNLINQNVIQSASQVINGQ
ncbi:hypothetical protein KGQ27_01960 [Patescibacteria group bacterium]|nr:hypothetical protein [Patescibacteria group bacterium]MDE1946317.1 hypothetical protein [Patescibacteria group bacterium]MDE2010769.1 hypothetical protein [Patescibacteria group bacterium]MDE2232654.1 hypothetical protein [Patescibacteria group bacterium]